jgi:hypothetical protein
MMHTLAGKPGDEVPFRGQVLQWERVVKAVNWTELAEGI